MFLYLLIPFCVALASGATLLYTSKRERDNGSAKLINRKYLEISFYDAGLKYDFFIPYSKIKALESALIIGKTTNRIYRINGALIPNISPKILGEEALLHDKNGEFIELNSFSEISF